MTNEEYERLRVDGEYKILQGLVDKAMSTENDEERQACIRGAIVVTRRRIRELERKLGRRPR